MRRVASACAPIYYMVSQVNLPLKRHLDRFIRFCGPTVTPNTDIQTTPLCSNRPHPMLCTGCSLQGSVVADGPARRVASRAYCYIYTGWRRINWTVQTFNRVYENLHKITPLTLVAHRLLQVVWYGMA